VTSQVLIGPSNDGQRHGRGTYLLMWLVHFFKDVFLMRDRTDDAFVHAYCLLHAYCILPNVHAYCLLLYIYFFFFFFFNQRNRRYKYTKGWYISSLCLTEEAMYHSVYWIDGDVLSCSRISLRKKERKNERERNRGKWPANGFIELS
jgi:hypothetical protein